jgi:tetratricopeptide (TPR) repeat protein
VAGGDHCTRSVPEVTARTASLLALVEHPEHAPCLYGLGVLLAWDGAAALARRALSAYIAQADDPADVEAATAFMRSNLPAHDVPPLAEAYHAAGERLRTVLGLPEEALAAFERAIAADAGLSWAYRGIGRIWEARHDLEQALVWQRTAVAVNGDDLEALRRLGDVAARTLRWEESLTAYRRAVALAPDNAESHAGAGRALLAVGREAEAVAATLRAVALDPDLDEPRDVLDARLGPDARWGPTPWWVRRGDPGGHHARAAQLARAGRLEQVLADARGGGASVDALLRLGALAEFAGQLDEAHAALERARALAPQARDVAVRAAAVAVRVGADAEVHALLDRAIDVVPWPLAWVQPRLPAHVSRGLLPLEPMLEHAVQLKIDVLLDEGHIEDARALAQRWGIVEPGVDYCGRARRTLTSAPHPVAEVFLPLREALLAQPFAGNCLWWLGQWLTDTGWVRMGRVVIEEAARVNRAAARGTAGAGYLRARLSAGRPVARRAEQLAILGRQRWVRGGDAAGARMLLEEAVAVDADAWRAHRNLGEVLARLERHDEAETQLRRALDLFPHDAGARLHLARVLWAQGRFEEYAAETRVVLEAARAWHRHLTAVQAFLAAFERGGAPRALPPVADPPMYVGWLFD